MEEIKYSELIEAFINPQSKYIDFWKKVARIERSIPRYNNKFNWWERTINFCNTYIIEHTIAGKTVSMAGLWDINLDLNTYDNHDTFHWGKGKGQADFYFAQADEKTDLKVVESLEDGLAKYCNDLFFSHNADSLLFYCLDTNKYYMIIKDFPTIELSHYGIYKNAKKETIIYYKVDLPAATLLDYVKPVSDEAEKEILANLPNYVYIERN